MSEQESSSAVRRSLASRPAIYEIRVFGRLSGSHWDTWFEGMDITIEDNGETVLRGLVADQAALYGLLAKLRDLALPLLLVERLEVKL